MRVTARNGNTLRVDESTRRNLEAQGLLQAPADSKSGAGKSEAKASATASRRSRSKG